MKVICVTPNKYCQAPEEVPDTFPLGRSADNHHFVDITNRNPQPQEWWYYDIAKDKFYEPEANCPMKMSEVELEWDKVRHGRNAMLAGSDWTQLIDSPKAVKRKWKKYRQELRDLPQTYMHCDPREVEYPYAPDRELTVEINRNNFLFLVKEYIKTLTRQK